MSDFKQNARPLVMVLFALGLIGAGVGEACGYPAPVWFVRFAIAVVGEWIIERGIRKSKGED